MLRTSGVAVVFVILVGSGVLHGVWTNRWGTTYDLAAFAERLGVVPLTIGDWDGRPADDERRAPAMRARSLLRTYVNRTDGRVVNLYLTCGPRGPVLFNH